MYLRTHILLAYPMLKISNCFPDRLVVECWLRVREVLVSIPSQGPRHTKDVIKMVYKKTNDHAEPIKGCVSIFGAIMSHKFNSIPVVCMCEQSRGM